MMVSEHAAADLTAEDEIAEELRDRPSLVIRANADVVESPTRARMAAKAREKFNLPEPSRSSLQWRDLPQSQWPYLNAEDEYLRSQYEMPKAALRWRWEGLGQDAVIEQLFARPVLERYIERLRVQLDLGRQRELGLDLEELETWRHLNDQQRLLIEGLLMKELAILAEAEEVEMVSVHDTDDGTVRKEMRFKPMTTRGKLSQVTLVEKLVILKRLLANEATQIIETRSADQEDWRTVVRETAQELVNAHHAMNTQNGSPPLPDQSPAPASLPEARPAPHEYVVMPQQHDAHGHDAHGHDAHGHDAQEKNDVGL